MIRKKDYNWSLYDRIPEATKGEFRIEKLVIPRGTRVKQYHPAGWYFEDKAGANLPTTRLECADGSLWMTDGPAEQDQIALAVTLARGDVLMIGLGLGLFVMDIQRRNKLVKSITIIEKSEDVVSLVYKYIKNSKTRVIIGEGRDSLLSAARKGIRYDFIYIDIWAGFTQPILEAQKWVDLAKPCLKEGGMVRYWMQELHERVKSKLPPEPVTQGRVVVGDPCLVCGKLVRMDYAGLCMNCADALGVSELYANEQPQVNP